jgi:hypothetical protein
MCIPLAAVQEFTPSNMKMSVHWPILAHTNERVGRIDSSHGDVLCGGALQGNGGKKEWGEIPLSTQILSLPGPIAYDARPSKSFWSFLMVVRHR